MDGQATNRRVTALSDGGMPSASRQTPDRARRALAVVAFGAAVLAAACSAKSTPKVLAPTATGSAVSVVSTPTPVSIRGTVRTPAAGFGGAGQSTAGGAGGGQAVGNRTGQGGNRPSGGGSAPSSPPLVAPATPAPTPPGVQMLAVEGNAPGHFAAVEAHAPGGAACSIAFQAPADATVQATGLNPQDADSGGLVTWSWMIDPATPTGKGTVTVTCTPGGTAQAQIPIG